MGAALSSVFPLTTVPRLNVTVLSEFPLTVTPAWLFVSMAGAPAQEE